MFLNVKQSQITKTLPAGINVDRRTFWKYYLSLLVIEKGDFISASEIEVLSSVLCKENNVSWFKLPNSDIIAEECQLKEANFRRVVYQLRDKGLIVPTEIRGDFVLCDILKKQKAQIEELLLKTKDINFIFPFKIE